MSAYDSRILGGTQATQSQYRAPARPPAPAPIRRQGGAPPPPGAPDDYASAQALFQKLLGPEIASLNSLYGDRAKSGMDAITGYTKQLAAALAPLAGQVSGIYSNAEQSQASSDAALRQALAGGGQGLANDLSAKLAAINAPGAQVSDVAGGQAATGANAGNAGYALGSAELGRLIGTGAAETGLAAKQPGIAGFTGLQKAGQLQQSLQSDLAGKVAGLEGQGPSFVQAQVNATRSSRQAQAKMAQDLALANQKTKQTALIAQDKSNQAWAKIQQGTANAADKRIYEQNLLALKQQGLISAAEARSAALALRQRGQDMTQWRFDHPHAKAPTGGLSAAALQKLGSNAATDAADAWHGVPDPKNPGQFISPPHLDYQKALQAMLGHYPLDVALKALDRLYARGTNGRPGLSIYERQALLSAGASPDAIRMGISNLQTANQLLAHYKIKVGDTANPSQAGGAGFDTAAKVIDTAKQFLGTAYKFGGASPQTGFDCSGLLTYAFGQQGVKLPHNAAQQFHMGKVVQPQDLKAGDAVFFVTDGTAQNPGHVGIYLGNGQVLTAPHTGAVVHIDQLAAHGGYAGARRYI